RAARNSEGRVLLYAYKETASMKKAIFETKRRRDIQDKYNKAHNIHPQTIIKEISGGIIETLRGKHKGKRKDKIQVKFSKENLTVENIEEQIKELSLQMKEASRELRFEDAAKIRDEIKVLKETRLLID
ncbi:MAG: UvrB/UvrC motif-containing protein, partial [Bdellovibrionales bacterium]|nr:UvrB/UvrC motif-containing protein [Bdellovibrionales bacterium]